MNRTQKLQALKLAKQLVLICSVHTPPEVKSSFVNYKVAQAAETINDLIKLLKLHPTDLLTPPHP